MHCIERCKLIKSLTVAHSAFAWILQCYDTIQLKEALHCIVSVLHQVEGGIGKSIPDARKISRDPRDFEISRVEGNLEGRGDGFPNTS